jgi:hypothetical protein
MLAPADEVLRGFYSPSLPVDDEARAALAVVRKHYRGRWMVMRKALERDGDLVHYHVVLPAIGQSLCLYFYHRLQDAIRLYKIGLEDESAWWTKLERGILTNVAISLVFWAYLAKVVMGDRPHMLGPVGDALAVLASKRLAPIRWRGTRKWVFLTSEGAVEQAPISPDRDQEES